MRGKLHIFTQEQIQYTNKITEVHLFQEDILSMSSEDYNTWNSFALIKYLCCYTEVKSNSTNFCKNFQKALDLLLERQGSRALKDLQTESDDKMKGNLQVLLPDVWEFKGSRQYARQAVREIRIV